MEKRNRIKIRCKSCGKRIWLKFNIDNENNIFSCICTNCGSHGSWKDRFATRK